MFVIPGLPAAHLNPGYLPNSDNPKPVAKQTPGLHTKAHTHARRYYGYYRGLKTANVIQLFLSVPSMFIIRNCPLSDTRAHEDGWPGAHRRAGPDRVIGRLLHHSLLHRIRLSICRYLSICIDVCAYIYYIYTEREKEREREREEREREFAFKWFSAS